MAPALFITEGNKQCGMITKKPEGAMIGNNGNLDGNIKRMLLKINNGKKIERNYSERMVTDGGGLK